MKKTLIFCLFLLSPALTYAFFCPTNFKNIEAGDSMNQVRASCGEPNSVQSHQKPAIETKELTYFMQQKNLSANIIKMQILVTNSQVKNITISDENTSQDTLTCQSISNNNQGNQWVQSTCHESSNQPQNVSNTRLCGQMISIGDDEQTVKSICGEPAMVNATSANSGDSFLQITEWNYQVLPKDITLIFENGKLKERR